MKINENSGVVETMTGCADDRYPCDVTLKQANPAYFHPLTECVAWLDSMPRYHESGAEIVGQQSLNDCLIRSRFSLPHSTN